MVLWADPAGGRRAAAGHTALGWALARRAAAAAHARAAQDPAAGGRGQEGPEQQHAAEVRSRVRRTRLFISHSDFSQVINDLSFCSQAELLRQKKYTTTK